MGKEVIPIFYSCDDNFVKYTIVSLYSMIKNASKEYKYHVYILNTNISSKMKEKLLIMANENFEISFEDVTDYLNSISDKFPIRDYYSNTTYYRLFIAEMFPEYNKAIYIDSDTIVQGDISKLYEIDIKDAYLGACNELAVLQLEDFANYVEKCDGISKYNFFNAGIIVINCEQFRLHFILDKFIQLLHTYKFVVAQDEDYLNVICKDHIYFYDQRWNAQTFSEIPFPIDEAYIVHYNMVSKPWYYNNCLGYDIFWQYAKDTNIYQELLNELNNYSDENKLKDQKTMENLLKMAVNEANKDDNYLNRLNKVTRSSDRVAILKKMDEFEKEGKFDQDLEQDPPGKVLLPNDINYLKKGFTNRVKTKFAYHMARKFVNHLLDEKMMIIKEIKGLENFKNLDSGAIITCNHFNPFDSFAIQIAYEASKQKENGRTFYRVIREGNYTSFPGFYGFLMRHCNTLPLSSHPETMKKFIKAVDTLLQNGHLVLVYPEQSLWWNYRKPKPLKKGAYNFASKNHVPVLPCFITMKDSDVLGPDGFYVQEYTINISKPIYPKEGQSIAQNTNMLLQENYEVWKEVYEKTYNIPLTYLK